MNKQEIKEDTVKSMSQNYEELRLRLQPVFNDKIKHVNGSLLKACFKNIGNIINAHQVLMEMK